MEASFDGALPWLFLFPFGGGGKTAQVRKDRGKTQAMLAKMGTLFAMYEPLTPVRRQTHPHVFSVK